MKLRATHRVVLEAELRRALAEGELFVVYQPIVQLGSGTAVGVEALVRWRHPSRGTVPPLVFIEVAEQTGLIRALGAFVLEAACQQFMCWKQTLGADAPTRLSVNLSRAQLADSGLVAQVDQVLRACGMPPGALQLEVTESLAAQDDQVRAQLQSLKALGLTLALDDFGTGYSSLSSLHQLPVDLVKIDRSFVSQLETSAHHRALVKATVEVAQSLGMGTVAEGIETPGQAAVLQALCCQKGQGYWFARPMPGDELPAWLAERAQGLRLRASIPAAASHSLSGSAA
jgi:EAL domain-containing protein (putative c-di-GMP-specific phosphodiesterase class I)